MALSLFGWTIGLLAAFSVIFCSSFGIWIIYRSRKIKANLLTVMGMTIIFTGAVLIGTFADFITMLMTGTHMEKTLFNLLSYSWAAGVIFCSMYIYAKLMIKEKFRKYFILFYFLLSILYLMFIFLDPINTFNVTLHGKPDEVLMQSNIVFMTPAFILIMIAAVSGFIFLVIGYLLKSIKSTGIIRKKYLYLSIGYMFWTIAGTLETIGLPGIFLIIVRLNYFFSAFLFYFGIREEPEKRMKPKKETELKGDLFRIAKRPDQITEEEVSISKEKKICLVCKGKVGRFMYMCPECESFYCDKCARALIELENACWACITPIDESRPVKPFKEEEEVAEIDVSEKFKK